MLRPMIRGGFGWTAVTPRVTLFPNYLHYNLNQASSALVKVIDVRNQNSSQDFEFEVSSSI
jgi:hypothetical protein